METRRLDTIADHFSNRRFSRRSALTRAAAGLAAGALAATGLPAILKSRSATAKQATGDFAGLVDVDGRSIYLEGRGEGGPTVVLVTGYRSSARYWTDDLIQPASPRKMVMEGVAEFTRVYAYDRPGTYSSIGDVDLPSRSDPISQPRNSADVVAELHALLQAAAVPGPYVLAAHSLGGFISRLYAATYPDEVVGLVLVDAFSEIIEDLMTPERWQALVKLNQDMGSDTVVEIPDYGDLETIGYGADNAVLRAALAKTPLPQMPLSVLGHGRPFDVPADAQEKYGFTSAELEALLNAANEGQAKLAPNGRYTVASESGHDVHQDQPELVIEAVRQVVAGVRNPDTWYELTSCCAE
jgi:pimeloyl-ACP methyl ester carboxylesterase